LGLSTTRDEFHLAAIVQNLKNHGAPVTRAAAQTNVRVSGIRLKRHQLSASSRRRSTPTQNDDLVSKRPPTFGQTSYGSRIVMNDWDMVEESVNGYPTGKPKRDIVPTDGMKITVGNRSVTIYLTPGHTPGTVSSIFQVHDHGRPLTVVYSGGTEFNFPNDVPHFDRYIASERRLASLAAGANATIVLNNQSQFNGAATKLRMLKDRHPGEAHPLDVGTNAVARYFKIEDECAQAVRLKVLAASGGRPQ
jgi:hypothetical protein